MLEQAIIDAKQLREAALQSAQQEIVEKYSEEVKAAVQTILEQPEDELGALGLDDLGDAGDAPADTFVDDVQMSHLSDDDEMIEIPLDQLIQQAAMETPSEDDMVDREDLDVGVPELEDEEQVAADADPEMEMDAANRNDDEIEFDDDEIREALEGLVQQEAVQVDAPDFALEEIELEEDSNDEKEEDEEMALSEETPTRDGQEEMKEALKASIVEIESLQEKIKQYKNILTETKVALEKVNASNARLYYTNKVLSDSSLNERQKSKIADMISEAQTVDEAKTIFETLQKTTAANKTARAKSLSETVERRSSTIISSRREEVSSTKQNPELSRWAVLAGLKRDQ
jgi:hypothetical protein|tara:strand:- start:34 stop:1065 length:1032 start_codon:yes stop_codon:yes gene_type:complete